MFRSIVGVLIGLQLAMASASAWARSAVPASVEASASSGPTPFPKDAKDWPGRGAIRVFPFMNDNRNSYWRERKLKQGSVVFAGDSLIGGWQATMAEAFPGVLLANRAIGGEPTRGLLFRFKEDVLDLHPRAIVLLTGTNDLSARQDIQETRSNLAEILDMAERVLPGVPIVLCTLPPRDHPKAPIDSSQLIKLNKLIVSVAQGRRQVALLDLYPLFADPDGRPHAEYFAEDRLHFSPAGYHRLREALAPVLKRFKVV